LRKQEQNQDVFKNEESDGVCPNDINQRIKRTKSQREN